MLHVTVLESGGRFAYLRPGSPEERDCYSRLDPRLGCACYRRGANGAVRGDRGKRRGLLRLGLVRLVLEKLWMQ